MEERRNNLYRSMPLPENETVAEELQRKLQRAKERVIGDLNYDEWILDQYIENRRYQTESDWGGDSNKYYHRMNVARRVLYWETVRMERLLRVQMVTHLVDSGGLQDAKAMEIRNWYGRKNGDWERNRREFTGAFDEFAWNYWYRMEWRRREQNMRRLELVFTAVNCWHHEHGTLPESLDVLVDTYLAGIPADSITGEPAKIHLDSLRPDGNVASIYNIDVRELGPDRNTGIDYHRRQELWKERFGRDFPAGFRGTWLQLGEWFQLLLEPPEEEQSRNL
jgi:hypothetical protein